MNRLFAFAGACGTGKTTLMNVTKDGLEGLGLKVITISEVAREVFSKFQKLERVNSLQEMRYYPLLYFNFQVDVLNAQIAAEDNALAKDVDVVLSDRSVADNLVYFLTWCSRETSPGLFDLYIKTVYQRMFQDKKYQKIFIVPPFGEKIDDGFRSSDLEYQEQQHQLAYMLIASYENSLLVEGNSFDTRKWFVLGKILRYYPNYHVQLTVMCDHCGKEVPYQQASLSDGVWWCWDCCQSGGEFSAQQEKVAVSQP